MVGEGPCSEEGHQCWDQCPFRQYREPWNSRPSSERCRCKAPPLLSLPALPLCLCQDSILASPSLSLELSPSRAFSLHRFGNGESQTVKNPSPAFYLQRLIIQTPPFSPPPFISSANLRRIRCTVFFLRCPWVLLYFDFGPSCACIRAFRIRELYFARA